MKKQILLSLLLGVALVGCSNNETSNSTITSSNVMDVEENSQTTTETETETTEIEEEKTYGIGDEIVGDKFTYVIKGVNYGSMYYYASSESGKYGKVGENCEPVYTDTSLTKIRNKAENGKKYVSVHLQITYTGKENNTSYWVNQMKMYYGDGYEMPVIMAHVNDDNKDGWYVSSVTIVFNALSSPADVYYIFEVKDDNEKLYLELSGEKVVVR